MNMAVMIAPSTIRPITTTIGYLERGDYSPSCELALKLAGYFKVPVEALFSLRPFPPLASSISHRSGDPS